MPQESGNQGRARKGGTQGGLFGHLPKLKPITVLWESVNMPQRLSRSELRCLFSSSRQSKGVKSPDVPICYIG